MRRSGGTSSVYGIHDLRVHRDKERDGDLKNGTIKKISSPIIFHCADNIRTIFDGCDERNSPTTLGAVYSIKKQPI